MFLDKQVCWLSNQWYQVRFSLRSIEERVTPETIEAMEVRLGDQVLGISFFTNTIPVRRIVVDSLFPWYDDLIDSSMVATAIMRMSWSYLNIDVVMALIENHIHRYIKPELAILADWEAGYDEERRKYWSRVDFLTGRLYTERIHPDQYEYIWRDAFNPWAPGQNKYQTEAIHPKTKEPYPVRYFFWLRRDYVKDRGPYPEIQAEASRLAREACHIQLLSRDH